MIERMRVVRSAAAAGLLAMALTAFSARADVTVDIVGALSGAGAFHSVRGFEFAVDSVNAEGGLLGQKLKAAFFDDGCNADQGEAAARRALDEHPALIVGHNCSAPSIRAAPLYARAGVVQISTQSTNTALTEMNIGSVFRLIGRDERQGGSAAALIARRWPGARIAVIDDGEPYGKGLAGNLQKALAASGIRPQLTRSFTPGAASYGEVVGLLARNKIAVLYIAGYSEDVGLLLHQIRAAGLSLQVLSGDTGGSETVRLAAGPAVEGLMYSSPRDPKRYPAVPALLARARAKGVELDDYAVVNFAAVEAWAQAVRQAGSFDADKVAEALHRGHFETVIGEVAFDDKGDVVGPPSDWVWYRWHDGTPEPDSGR